MSPSEATALASGILLTSTILFLLGSTAAFLVTGASSVDKIASYLVPYCFLASQSHGFLPEVSRAGWRRRRTGTQHLEV